jgi:DNA-binding IclR family transcriptional regulator
MEQLLHHDPRIYRISTLEQRNIVKVILKTTQILECFSQEKNKLTISDIVSLSRINKTTVRRIINTLEIAGWVEQTTGKAFQLSIRLFELGSIVANNIDLRTEAKSIMSKLTNTFKKGTYLFLKTGTIATCIDIVEANVPIRIQQFPIGQTLPLYVGGGPFAILAFSDEIFINELLKQIAHSLAKTSNINIEKLQTKLEETKKIGYSLSLEDVYPGVAAVGAPIYDQNGKVIGAIGMGGLLEDFQNPQANILGNAIKESAAQISMRMGYLSNQVNSKKS